MFHDLDTTIGELLKRDLPPQLVEQVSISFATPDGQFPPASVTLPAINLFLYEIQENRELRSAEPLFQQQSDGRVIQIPAPVRVDCHYLVTAWAQPGAQADQDEHRILGNAMLVLLRYREIPAEVLQGSMKDQPLPLRAATLQLTQQQTRGDFWQALGGKPKAAFDYTVTIAATVDATTDGGGTVLRTQIKGGP